MVYIAFVNNNLTILIDFSMFVILINNLLLFFKIHIFIWNLCFFIEYTKLHFYVKTKKYI